MTLQGYLRSLGLSDNFQQQLDTGKVGEGAVSQWLMARGCKVLPVYEISENQFKGPVFYDSPWRKLVAPDSLVFGDRQIFWAEVKTKSAFTKHRITGKFVTGIDLHHYEDYIAVQESSNCPVWLFFYHKDGQAKDSDKGPSGLYGQSLNLLLENENHRSQNWGKHGMVYWAENSLRKFSEYPLSTEKANVNLAMPG